jgi:hypothetical protein
MLGDRMKTAGSRRGRDQTNCDINKFNVDPKQRPLNNQHVACLTLNLSQGLSLSTISEKPAHDADSKD